MGTSTYCEGERLCVWFPGTRAKLQVWLSILTLVGDGDGKVSGAFWLPIKSKGKQEKHCGFQKTVIARISD